MKTIRIISTILFAITYTLAFSQSTFRKTIKVKDRDKGKYICQTIDGGYIITGETFNYLSLEDVLLVKTDMHGDTLWAKSYGEAEYQEYSYWVKENLDKGFIIAAHTNSSGGKAWIIKTDAAGDTLWTRTLDGRIYNILPTADSAYLMAG